MTTLQAPSITTTRAPQWVRTFTFLLGGFGTMLTLWFWVTVLPSIALILFIVNRFTLPQSSGVAFSYQGTLWFPFSMAILMVVTYLPIHVANGLTRRSFASAAIVLNVGVGLFNAVITTAALLVEREIFDALGWFHGSLDGTRVSPLHDGAANYALGLALLLIAGQLSGLLVGLTYYRTNGWLGTLLLPLTLLPILLVSMLGPEQWQMWALWDVTVHPAWGNALSLLVLVAAVTVIHRLARGVTIATKKA